MMDFPSFEVTLSCHFSLEGYLGSEGGPLESVLSYLDGGVGEDPCDNLRKGEYTIMVCCCMCRYSGEGVNHLLIHCKVAYQLWCFVLTSFGISWVLPRSVKDILFGWQSCFGKKLLDIWNMVPLSLMWTLW